jgi:hypothetical protein
MTSDEAERILSVWLELRSISVVDHREFAKAVTKLIAELRAEAKGLKVELEPHRIREMQPVEQQSVSEALAKAVLDLVDDAIDSRDATTGEIVAALEWAKFDVLMREAKRHAKQREE